MQNIETKIAVSFCGLDNAGKTSIIRYLVDKKFKKTTPSLGVATDECSFRNVNFRIFDLGGQIQLRKNWELYLPNSNVCTFVIDAADPMRLPEVKEEFDRVVSLTGKTPMVVVLNKQDLASKVTKERIRKNLAIIKQLKKRKWTIIETSALNGQGLPEIFNWICTTTFSL